VARPRKCRQFGKTLAFDPSAIPTPIVTAKKKKPPRYSAAEIWAGKWQKQGERARALGSGQKSPSSPGTWSRRGRPTLIEGGFGRQSGPCCSDGVLYLSEVKGSAGWKRSNPLQG